MFDSPVLSVDLPPLPSYTLALRPLILPPLSDSLFILLPPVVAYWTFSLFWHWIDVNDYLAKYRLHTPVEVLHRNRASKRSVIQDVLLQHFIQTLAGAVLAIFDEPEYTGKDEYNVMLWASRLRIFQALIPGIMSFVGVDSIALAKKLATTLPTAAAMLAGGKYPHVQTILSESGEETLAPAFAAWELSAAYALYWYLIPLLQFTFAIAFVDTWQYVLHRAMHMNKTLYRMFHSRHHQLYVPYAFGALYNHPVEGFALDTAGTGLAYLLTGLSYRQGAIFFAASTLKTVDDHCGYALPFDPFQMLTSNNAAYHDIHHQSWGIKTNFSQPFFTFWDGLLGTKYQGNPEEMQLKYERSRQLANSAQEKQQQQQQLSPAEKKDKDS